MRTGQRMLILSALTSADGYPQNIYRRFAGSLVRSGFNGDINIMVIQRNYDRKRLWEVEEEFPGLIFCTIPDQEDYGNINCFRYKYYIQFLEKYWDRYDRIMISDARDVIFQKDISAYPFDPGIDLYFAEEEKKIMDCGINSGWITDLFGQDVCNDIRTNYVLCSGTTIGKPESMYRYLMEMSHIIDQVKDQFIDRFGHLGGIDQGIHNFIYYKNRLPMLNIKVADNCENLIYTVGYPAGDDPNRKFLDDDHRFITKEGELATCVHQFDRLDDRIRKLFNEHSEFSI